MVTAELSATRQMRVHVSHFLIGYLSSVHRAPPSPMMRALRSLSFAFPLAVATAANGADLLEVYRMAQTADAQYSAARAAWSAGQEKLPQGLSGLLPSATVSARSPHND